MSQTSVASHSVTQPAITSHQLPVVAAAGKDALVVKIPRKAIPVAMKYDDYIMVYRSLLQWIATIKLTEGPGPIRKAEEAFLSDHAKLQK